MRAELDAAPTAFATADGRRIAGLECTPRDEEAAATVVLAPGYQRCIQHGSVLSRQLVRDGCRTVRFDLTDHLGLSDGDMRDFTLSSMAHDTGAVLGACAERWPGPLFLVASSLGARAAIRALADDIALAEALDRAVLVLPVIDTQGTLAAAIGHDVIAEWRSGAVTDPDRLCDVLGNHVRYAFCADALAQRLDDPDTAVREVASLPCAITAIAAERDDWVALADVRRALEAAAPAARELVVMEATSHDLAHNPPAMKLLLEATEEALGLPAPGPRLTFDEIVETVRTERAWRRQGYEGLAPERTP